MIGLKDRYVKIKHMSGSSYNVNLSDRTTIDRGISEGAVLSTEFVSTTPLDTRRGDRFELDGELFFFPSELDISMNSSGEYLYKGKAYSTSHCLDLVSFLFLDIDKSGEVRNLYENRCDFSVTATLSEFADLIIKNLERASFLKGWSVSMSSELDIEEIRTIAFDRRNCKEALKEICDKYGIEWVIENKEILLSKELKRRASIKLEYGENLLSPLEIKKSDTSDTCTKLLVFGGERNIPEGYNDGRSSRLLMEGKQEYIMRADSKMVYEKVKIFDDIFPQREGIIESVSKSEGIFYVRDNSIDFDINKQLTDNTAKIAFNSGYLVGKEFEISGYNDLTKTIEIRKRMDGDVEIPNDLMCPRPGDKYVILDITMPDSYVTRAEKRLKDAAYEYFEESCGDKISVKVELSNTWQTRMGIQVREGMMVRLYDGKLGIDRMIRVTKVKQHPFDGGTYGKKTELTLSDYVQKSKLQSILGTISNTSTTVKFSVRNITNNNNTVSNITNINGEANDWLF